MLEEIRLLNYLLLRKVVSEEYIKKAEKIAFLNSIKGLIPLSCLNEKSKLKQMHIFNTPRTV